MATRNSLLTKLATSRWEANPSAIRTTALALSYSTAEYAPAWARSPHAKNLDPGLNQACRSVTGCLNATNVEDLYLLSGIAPPATRRDVCSRVDRQKQSIRDTYSLFGQIPATKHLSSVQPTTIPEKFIGCSEWRRRLHKHPHICIINTFTKRWRKYTTVHGPRENSSTVCARVTLAVRHKERSGSSTQETPHVLVEMQKKPRHTCYSAPNLHIPARWMISLRSMM